MPPRLDFSRVDPVFLHPRLDRYYGGMIPSPHDPRDYPMAARPEPANLRAILANHDLRSYKNTGQSLMMPIGDQGQLGSCTAWAWGYYFRGAAAARDHLEKGTTPDVGDTLSAGWLYDVERGPEFLDTYPQDSGADMRSGAAVLQKYGVPPTRYSPYTGRADNGPVEQEMDSGRLDAAAYYGISGYYRLAGTGSSLINSGLQCLDDGWPFTIAFLVYDSFERVGSDGIVRMPARGERLLGAHAMCVFGNFYDNSFPGGGCWIAPNQWGTGFGQGGLVYIPWAYNLQNTVGDNQGPPIMEMWTGR